MSNYQERLDLINNDRKNIEKKKEELRYEIIALNELDKCLFECAKNVHEEWQREDYDDYKENYPFNVI